MNTYAPDYPTCAYTHVWLRVLNEELDSDEISRVLKLQPTRTIRAGETISEKSPRTQRYSG